MEDCMARANRYTSGLEEGQSLLGVFCCLDGFSVSHILAKAGFDFLLFDRQHAAYSWPELEQMCFRVQSEGAAVFIRTGSAEQQEIDLALDLPVDGIVIPNVASFEEAQVFEIPCQNRSRQTVFTAKLGPSPEGFYRRLRE